MCANRFEVYEYMQPLASLDEVNGEFITKKITLASGDTPSPFEMSRHTLWCSIPGGYWDYTKPWTKKALNMIIGIQMDLDAGRVVSNIPEWKHCRGCGAWTSKYHYVCDSCDEDCYD